MRKHSSHRRIALGGIAMIGVTFGLARYGYGLFLPDLRQEFGLSVPAVGLIGSATYAGYLLAVVLVGALAARLGPRALVLAGGLSAAGGMAVAGTAEATAVLVAGLVLAGTSPGWSWAPFSDAVDRAVPPERREGVMALIPSGTAAGAAIAGPVAMLTPGPAWRIAWLVFAAMAVAATAYNARALPGRAPGGVRERPPRLATPAAVPLYLAALSYGVIGAVYWTFAAEIVSGQGGNAALFWTVMGVAGMAGVFTGGLMERLGLTGSRIAIFLSLGAAIALLGVAPGSLPAAMASAAVYGPAFMAGSGLLAVWSYRVFPERPAAGFSAVVLGVGTIAGPALLGAFAGMYGLRAAFVATAVIAVVTAVRLGNKKGLDAPAGLCHFHTNI